MRLSFFKILLLLFIFLGSYSSIDAQQSEKKFVQETNYLLYFPKEYLNDTITRWPLLFFLHGSGESGFDIKKIKANGPPELADNGKQFPFIIVSPQSEVPSGWDVEILYRLLKSIKKNYRVDEKRIYMTGLSMGGFGTWQFAMKYPDELAAIAPVCGGGDTSNAWKLRNMGIWCFHGAKDDVVSPAGSENMVKAAKRFNENVKFTLYPEANHNSWDITYNNDSLYSWLLKQNKFSYSEKLVNAALLKTYEGFYLGPDKDTVQMIVEGNKLIAKPGKETIPLKAAGNNLFFIEANKNMDIRFLSDKGTPGGFIFMGDRQLLYKKFK